MDRIEQLNSSKLSRELVGDLKATSEKLGFFYPVLKGADGKVIDGNHRLGANPKWPSKKLPYTADSLKGVLAKGLCNFVRRGIHIDNFPQWLDEVEKAAQAELGRTLSAKEIAELTSLKGGSR